MRNKKGRKNIDQPLLMTVLAGHFMAVLKARSPAGLRWTCLHLPGEDHDSTKLKTLYQGLEFIFREPERGRAGAAGAR